MKARATVVAALAVALCNGAVALAGPLGPSGGFVTSRPAQLVAVAFGVVVAPVISAGDVVGGYQASGVMDGVGLYRSSPSTVEVFVNHELGGSNPTFSRVSHFTLDNAGGVVSASYPVDGSEGYKWLCSATLTTIDGTPWFTTGEEDEDPGRAIALNALTGEVIELAWLGLLAHENVVPLTQLGRNSPVVVMISEDESAGRSQQYAYIAPTWSDVLAGDGQLHVWVPDAPLDGDPSPDDIAKGETIAGHFVPISSAGLASAAALESEAQALGAFDFVRGEDVTEAENQPGVVYLADTGTQNKEDDNGRIYRFQLDRRNVLEATLTVVLDSAVDPIVNPDNIGASSEVLVIQEDRNWENRKRGFSDVWAYRFATGALTKVARVNVPPRLVRTAGGGSWESSGVVDASDELGDDWWLLTVQAHSAPSVPQPGPSLVPGSASGEDAQLVLLKIPDST